MDVAKHSSYSRVTGVVRYPNALRSGMIDHATVAVSGRAGEGGEKQEEALMCQGANVANSKEGVLLRRRVWNTRMGGSDWVFGRRVPGAHCFLGFNLPGKPPEQAANDNVMTTVGDPMGAKRAPVVSITASLLHPRTVPLSGLEAGIPVTDRLSYGFVLRHHPFNNHKRDPRFSNILYSSVCLDISYRNSTAVAWCQLQRYEVK